jgi:hypothetical protein
MLFVYGRNYEHCVADVQKIPGLFIRIYKKSWHTMVRERKGPSQKEG